MIRLPALNVIPAPLLLLTAAAAWGVSNVEQKAVLAKLGPVTVVGLSSLIAAAALYPIAVKELKRSEGPRGIPVKSFIAPVAAFVLAIVTFQAGLAGTSVSNASFLAQSSIVMTPVLTWLLCGERLSPRFLMPLGSAAAGLSLITGGFTPSTFGPGDGVCLLSAFFYSISIILNGRFVETARCPGLLSTIQFAVCGLICTVLGLCLEPVNAASIAEALPDLVFIGLAAKALPYFLITKAQQRVSASVTNLLTCAEAPVAAASSYAFLGESMSAAAVAGASLVMSAIFMSEAAALRAAARRLHGWATSLLAQSQTTREPSAARCGFELVKVAIRMAAVLPVRPAPEYSSFAGVWKMKWSLASPASPVTLLTKALVEGT